MKLTTSSRARGARRRVFFVRPMLEILEDRLLLADGINPSSAPQIHGQANVALNSVTVATFTIADSSGDPGTMWNAKIDWGDGSAPDKRAQATDLQNGTFAFLDSHTYAAKGTYTITVMIAVPGSHLPNDNTVSTSAVIAAALTSIAVTPVNPSVAKGLTKQFTATGTFADNTTQNITSQVSWGSSSGTVATITAAGLARAAALGTSTISASLSGIGGSTVMTVTAAVLQSISVTPANPSIVQGATKQFTATGTFSDNTTQNLTNQATWGSATPGVATITTSGLATGVGAGTSTISATLSGIAGTTVLTVTAPSLQSIAVTPASPTLPVGQTQQFSATGTFSDNSTQILTNQVNWTSGTPTVASITAAGLASGLTTGTSTIAAAWNGVTGSTVLTVKAIATQLVLSNLSSTSITAGGTVSFTISAEDNSNQKVPGYTGTVQLTSTDNSAFLGASQLPTTYTFVSADNGAHTFVIALQTAGSRSITVTDQANSTLTATTGPITVAAGALNKFVFNFFGGTTIVAGNSFLFTAQAADQFGNAIMNYTGASNITVAAGPTTDPLSNFPLDGTVSSIGSAFFLGTLKTVGTYVLTASAGALAGVSAALTVVPAAADYFTVTAPNAATTGNSFSATVTAFDAYGNLATGYTGTIKLSSTDAAAALGGNYSFTTGPGQDNGQHTFAVTLNMAGSQKITAMDVAATKPLIIGISNTVITSGLQVSTLTPTPTGFTVTFNKPFIPADITLYGGSPNTVADVVLTGNNGVGLIHGSLLIDPSKQSFTFKATSAYLQLKNSVINSAIPGYTSYVLPDATYTAKLISGAGTNGFMDTLQAGLDGLGNQGHANYTTTFTTHFQADASPILALPDFSRGPDSNTPIAVPANLAGIPITLTNATNVTDVTFSLNYNPTFLNITGAVTGAGSDANDPGASLTLLSNASGVATFHYLDVNPISATSSSPLILGDIGAVVPSTAGAASLISYQVKELLHLTNIVIDRGAISGAVGSDGIHVNAYFGDVNGDKVVDGLDKLAADNVAQGRVSGFSAYGQLDPVIIGDVAGDLAVDAGDVGALDSYVAQLHPAQIPQTPTQLNPSNPHFVDPKSINSPNAADPTLSIQKGAAGVLSDGMSNVSRFIVVINIDHPDPEQSTGLTSATLALTYDPSLLSVSSADIELGSIPSHGNGWQMSSVVDRTTGQIGIQLYSLTPITATQAGSLVNIAFHILPSAAVAATAVQLVNAVTPDGQWFGTGLADSQGAMILSPGIDRLLIPTGAEVVSLASAIRPGNSETTGQWSRQLLSDALISHDSDATEETTVLLAKPEGQDEPQPMTAASLWLPANAATLPLGQTFQIGNLPLLNNLLYQNSPGAPAVDRLFLALVRSADDTADPKLITRSLNSLIWDAFPGLDWLGALSESETQPVCGAMIRQENYHRSEVDRSAAIDQFFADASNEWNAQ
jgi:Bacterial Ig-like domain (group 2)